MIFGPTGDPRTFLRPRVSWDGRWLFVYVWYGWKGVEVLVRDLTSETTEFRPFYKSDEAQIWVEEHKGFFYISSNEGASNKQLFRVRAGVFDRDAWELIVPESNQAVLEEFHLSKGKLLLRYTANAQHYLQIHGFDGRLLHKVATPGLGVTRWIKSHPEKDAAFFTFSCFSHPWQSIRLSMEDGSSSIWSDTEVPVDPSRYMTEQIWYRSKDGTQVPMFVIHRKDLPRDGSTPFLLYGYGGFDISVMPTFFPAIFAWLEAGGGYAAPNLRGGGEFGKTWIEEYGSPKAEADFRVLYDYSPYHHVASNVAYPPTLIRTAENDDRVHPAHARKMTAALQATNAGAGNPVLLKIDRQAGHGGAGKISADVRRWTDNYAFLMYLFGMTPNSARLP